MLTCLAGFSRDAVCDGETYTRIAQVQQFFDEDTMEQYAQGHR